MAGGRPRAFDMDKALDSALKVFWKKGYEGTSLPDLTEAMGINRPSLYAAFGNKEALFRKVMQRYVEGPGSHSASAFKEPTAYKVVEALLHSGICTVTNPRNPHGCLMVQSALACGDDAQVIRRELAKHRKASEVALAQRFEQAKSEGDLPADTHCMSLARYVMAVAFGLAVQSTHGATREDLMAVADVVLKTWPVA